MPRSPRTGRSSRRSGESPWRPSARSIPPNGAPMSDARPKLLFVCVENSCRSQIAEGFARALGADAHSAGSRPSGKVNPRAVAFMKEKGIDLGVHASKSLNDIPQETWGCVVTMGCGDACPHVPAKHRLDWDLPDPKHLDNDAFRAVRDRIERLVGELLRAAEATEAGRGGEES